MYIYSPQNMPCALRYTAAAEQRTARKPIPGGDIIKVQLSCAYLIYVSIYLHNNGPCSAFFFFFAPISSSTPPPGKEKKRKKSIESINQEIINHIISYHIITG